MTSVTGTTFQPPVTGGPGEAPKQELGQEEFLSLLMTQMSNQDPLNPMDSDQFMNQITQMNSLQQQISTNERLDDLVLAMGALNNETAVNLVGRSVVVEGNAFPHEQGAPEDLTFELPKEAAEVSISIKDADGKIVDVITMTDVPAGETTAVWDGIDEAKKQLPDGDYTFSVAAEDADGNPMAVTTFVSGVVDELRFDGGAPQVVVGGQVFQLSAITRVIGGSEAAAPVDPYADADPVDPDSDPASTPGVTAANVAALKATLQAMGITN